MLIEDAVSSGTPQFVIDSYATLAERAKTQAFGLIEEDVIVLDTETTGLSVQDNELIEISAARLSGREVIERFDTFVHPKQLIPAEITELTSITNADVADAPSAVEAVAALADFVGGCPVIAHNATFDRSFIESVKGGVNVSDIWIDSLALSRIALPRLASHKLSFMADLFGCDSVSHRANADVDALCGVWRVLLVALTDLPQGLMARLATCIRTCLGPIVLSSHSWQGRTLVLSSLSAPLVLMFSRPIAPTIGWTPMSCRFSRCRVVRRSRQTMRQVALSIACIPPTSRVMSRSRWRSRSAMRWSRALIE